MSKQLDELQQEVYYQRQAVKSLHYTVYEQGEVSALDQLIAAQAELFATEQNIASQLNVVARAELDNAGQASTQVSQGQEPQTTTHYRNTPRDGRQQKSWSSDSHRALDTTGLEVKVYPLMKYVPTAIYHLLDPETYPLIQCRVQTKSGKKRRLRIIAYIEGYTAQAVQTIELSEADGIQTTKLLPTFFPDRVRSVRELTRATINVLAEDLVNREIEQHITKPIWLLPRNSAPLEMLNPTTGEQQDFSRYLGAFVTPNQPRIRRFLHNVVEHHPEKRLEGYRGTPILQAQAVFEALRERNIAYVHSPLSTNPDDGAKAQRVRLPRETLKEKQANCLDATLLFASLLEAMSLNPAIVIIPGHAFVGWEQQKDSNNWQYLELTSSRPQEFEAALETGETWVETFKKLQKKAEPREKWFRRFSLQQLRTEYQITPME